MADAFNVDMVAVKALAVEFGTFGARLRPMVKATITKGALNIKNAAKQSIIDQTRHVYVTSYPNSITYDVRVSAGATVTAEIGPDKRKPQGALGNLLEYGSSRNPPMPHLAPSLDAEAGNTESWLATGAEIVLLGGAG